MIVLVLEEVLLSQRAWGIKAYSGDLGASLTTASTGSTMSTVFGIVVDVYVVVIAAVAAASTEIGSMSALSIGCGNLVAPFFFGTWAALVAAIFQLCSNSKIVSELSDSLSS